MLNCYQHVLNIDCGFGNLPPQAQMLLDYNLLVIITWI
ncbi:hypothetical protein ADIWIN_1205 [Winogradskyella psychrotolerans RS-3]|uniref:Uncharacterized protein n=1 Tax=Winogradskyella psychrotolerans RS-3 TaxID=641526 RepID=S7VU92_9FLAO|nr:hypothetical protein ADIWIN_1205 [Winogradskyella psychrotolerans RS-3]